MEFPNNLSTTKSNKIDEEFTIHFRNYNPINHFDNFVTEKLDYFDTIEEIESEYANKVKKAIKDFINLEKNPLNILPKKNNIDLKKNLSNKLAKLNKRTETALIEIISKFNCIYILEEKNGIN